MILSTPSTGFTCGPGGDKGCRFSPAASSACSGIAQITNGLGSVLIVEVSGQPIAAAVLLAWNGTVIYKFGASDASRWSLRPNHLLFWHAIRAACEQGYRWFDFGRTDIGQEGLRNFKLSWGAVEEPLLYGTLGGKPGSAPTAGGMATRMLGPVIRHGPLLLSRAFGETLYRYVA